MTTNRRDLLRMLAIAPAAATGGAVMLPAAAQAQAAAAGLITGNVCALMPEVTEGPYYLDEDLVRADIREDRPGIPLVMRLQVVTADCQPIEGARVDLWHCDAQGNYSGYAGQGSDTTQDTKGQTFLRGTQVSDASGIVAFQTIYPGWYASRTVHIHFKVWLDKTQVLTGQIFFPDALSQYIFDNAPDYGGRAKRRDTINIHDHIAAEAGAGAYAAVREQPQGYEAALVVGVDPEARSVGGSRPGGPSGGPPPGPPPGDGGPMGGGGDWQPADLIPTAGQEE